MFIRKYGLFSCIFFVCFVIGGYFFGKGVVSYFDAMVVPSKFDELKDNEFVTNLSIEGDILASVKMFEESYDVDKNNEIIPDSKKCKYLIVRDDKYMGFETSDPQEIAAMDKLTAATLAYLSGESIREPEPVHFTGEGFTMSSKTTEVLQNTLKEMDDLFDSHTILDFKAGVYKDINFYYIESKDFSFNKDFIKKGAIFWIVAFAALLIKTMILKSRNNRDYVYIERDT